MRSILLPVACALLLTGCGESAPQAASARQPVAQGLHVQRLLVLDRPPVIAAQEPADLPLAIRAAEGTNADLLDKRDESHWVRTDALPFLTETKAGRAFLAAHAPRALARGMPKEYCPALATATGQQASASAETARGEVARRALTTCIAKLGAHRKGCGCRVIALNDVVTVPREEMAYATGVTARMRVPKLGIDLMLVAEHAPGKATILRDLNGPVARLVDQGDDRVAVDFTGTNRHFEGRRIVEGFRRGRLAERVYAKDAQGHRMSLLIGFEPDELAGQAGAWMAWPAHG